MSQLRAPTKLKLPTSTPSAARISADASTAVASALALVGSGGETAPAVEPNTTNTTSTSNSLNSAGEAHLEFTVHRTSLTAASTSTAMPSSESSGPTTTITATSNNTTTTANIAITSTNITTKRKLRSQADAPPPLHLRQTAATSARVKAVPKTSTPSTSTTSSATTTSRSSAKPTALKASLSSATSTVGAAESADGGPPPKKKRAAWDVKGRLEDMEEYNKSTIAKLGQSSKLISGLTDKLNEGQEQINQLVTFKMSLENKFQMKEMENGEMANKLRALQDQLENTKRTHENEVRALQNKFSNDMDDAIKRESKLKSDLNTTTSDYERVCTENNALKNSLSTQSTSLITLESDIRASKVKIESLESLCSDHLTQIMDLESKLKASEDKVANLEKRLRDDETIRRKLHNMIQELKGNIRVFCRIRPPIESELSQDALSHIKFSDVDDKSLELLQNSENASGQGTVIKTYPFSFDKVFSPKSSQSEVFDEISQLVQSALDGYNVCIFAYGQTGSGKTYTMEGSNIGSSENSGMIPRAVAQIFETAEALESKGWTYTFEAWFLEIYNESIRDLLIGATGGNVKVASNSVKAEKFEIRHAQGKTLVTDVIVVPVKNGREVHSLLKRASSNRAVAATNSNEHSSRSHSVFTLRLSGYNSLTEEHCDGVLNLIDLAGSERLSVSGAVGDRLKETQAINKSLSSLGDVIFALGNKDQQHIPYRNSKLTFLLQNSLGGNSKTLMFVNVNPCVSSFGETLCSLRFATKVDLDNSEWMRNGDYTPSRLEAQNDAVNLLFNAKTQSNPENTVGLMTMAGKGPEVLVTLTSEVGKILTALHKIKIAQQANISTGVQIAQLALKHRQNKNQRQRIIVFVGSPLSEDEKSLVKLGKKLKKNNIAVDIINFGEDSENTPKLEAFINAVNSSDNSHLVTIPPGPHVLSDILISSPILADEDGAPPAGFSAAGAGGFEFGIDPSLDPELALALRISMEEERARQEALNGGGGTSSGGAPEAMAVDSGAGELAAAGDDELAAALAISMGREPGDAMEEDDDEIAKAIALSMQDSNSTSEDSSSQNPEFITNLLGSLPGVDPNDPRFKSALSGTKKDEKKDEEEKK
ncbi:Kinesin-like protein kifc1 [Physocladia obscura]|uniref:Kinesin-like protein kifc1 n=1 Tax=Physocladia obscura TaxID=109957 RepID=A0AAD5T7D6_9FUNG|nr:Kinesin-like protein kifc1 [Physocladia obscura]